MNADELARLLRDLQRLVGHIHVVLVVMLLVVGAELGVTIATGGC